MSKSSRRRAKHKAKLFAAHNEQAGLCFYCDRRTWLPWEDASDDLRLMATREHIIRKCDGGTDADENITMACMDCNSRRGKTAPEKWLDARTPAEPPDEVCLSFGGYDLQTPDFDAVSHVQENGLILRCRKRRARAR